MSGGPLSVAKRKPLLHRIYFMRAQQKRRLAFLGGFAGYFIVLWLFWPSIWVYPLKIFVVFLHELSHALAGIATGGTVQRIVLDPYEGGATYVNGGNAFILLSAGYLGSLLWGLGLLLVARTRPKFGRHVAFGLSIVFLAVTALFVRNPFGFVFGLFFGLALLLASRKLPDGGIIILLTTLGLTSALYAVLDIRDDILSRPDAASDAHMLSQLTGVPTLAWGFFWGGVA